MTNDVKDKEQAIVKDMFSKIENLKESHPDFFADFEDNADTADRADLVRLMETSPNDQVKFLLLGKFMMRMEIAEITGREFR